MDAFIVTEDYNRAGRYRFTAYRDREAAGRLAAGITPGSAARYVTEWHGPKWIEKYGPDWATEHGYAEVHVQVHAVRWPEHDGQPDERATVVGLSLSDGFDIQLIVVKYQGDLDLEQFPYFEGYSTICPEDEAAVLVLDGPTCEGGDTAI